MPLVEDRTATFLRHLVRSESFPTVGEIWSASAQQYSRLKDEEDRALMWRHFDDMFGTRADYLLWRLLFRNRNVETLSKRDAELTEIAIDGINSPEPVVAWGVLSLLSGVLTGKRAINFSEEQQNSLVLECEHRLFNGLKPLTNGEVHCALIKIFLTDAIQKFRHSLFGPMSTTDAVNYLSDLEKYIREVDPLWFPGKIPIMKNIYWNGKSNDRHVIPLRGPEIQLRLGRSLFSARGAVRSAIKIIDKDAEALLQKAALFSISTWRLARAQRIGVEKVIQLRRGAPLKFDFQRLLSDEMQALRRAAQAMLDAGQYLTGAGLGHLLLRVMPDSLIGDERFKDLADDIGFFIRETGLEVDKRFWRPMPRKRTLKRELDGLNITKSYYPEDVPVGFKFEHDLTSDPNIYRLRQIGQQETDPRWVGIMKYYAWHPKPLEQLIHDVHQDKFYDKRVIEDAFDLCLEYGQIEQASQLTRYFVPDKRQLLKFAYGMRNSLRVMPFGMHIKTHREWQTLLRNDWANLPETEWLTGKETLIIHEVLLGRCLSVIRNAGTAASKAFVDKFYGRLSDGDIRDAFDDITSSTLGGPGIAVLERIQMTLREMSNTALGSPLCVSLVALGNGRWSILAINKDRLVSKRITLQNLRENAKSIAQTYKLWFRNIKDRRATRLGVPWGKEFAELGNVLNSLIADLAPQARWIVFAVEPELAMLPWQDLFSRYVGKRLLVSLAPSVGWASFNYTQVHNRQGFHYRLSNAPDLHDLRQQIDSSRSPLLAHKLSAAFVLGHGTLSDNGIPTIVANKGQPITLSEWISISEYRVAIVHSCFAGKVQHQFLGDMGGLPGMMLGLGCRLLCAPVAEVPVKTASILHKHLTQNDGPREIGLRYLAAIEDDPAVTVYNLYGFANEGAV